jgi:hypothetical protein
MKKARVNMNLICNAICGVIKSGTYSTARNRKISQPKIKKHHEDL